MCEKSDGRAYRLGQLHPAQSPPVAVIVGSIQPKVGPRDGAQDGAVRAQGQDLDPVWDLVVVDGLSARLCAPQVHTTCTQESKQPLRIGKEDGFMHSLIQTHTPSS